MAKDKGNKPPESTYILSQADVDKIAKDASDNARRRSEYQVGGQDQNMPDDLAARFDKLEKALTGDEQPRATREEVRAVIKKYAPNLIKTAENDDMEDVVLKVLNDLPNTTPEVIEEILMEQIGQDFGKQMAMQESLDNGEIPTVQQIEKFGKMFTQMIMAEERGEDPDMSEFRTPPSSFVDQAVEEYAASEQTDQTDNLKRRLSNVRNLFKASPTPLLSNKPYRFLARFARAVMAEPNIHVPTMFPDHRKYSGEIDGDAVQKIMRRLDTEVRNLDPVDREEFIYKFVDKVLGQESTNELRGWSWASGEMFRGLSEESSKALHDLVLFYFFAKAHYAASLSGWETVNRKFDGKTIDNLLEIGEEVVKRPFYPDSQAAIRYVAPEEYKDILCLTKALYHALPDRFCDTVHAAISLDPNLDPDIITDNHNGKLSEASKQLRNTFIAISQNRGSFETFFTELHRFYSILKKELNNKVEMAYNLVNLYDHLNISISPALKESRQRILEVPF